MLLGCTARPSQQPADCANLIDARLETFPFNGATEQSVLAWISNRFALGPDSVRIGPTSAGIEFFDWESGTRAYTAALWNGSEKVASVSGQWRGQAPTVGDALRCLGAPKSYRAYYHLNPDAGPWTYLELWYPERGLQVRTLVERRVSSFDEGLPLKSVQHAQPGAAQELIARFWIVEIDSDAYRRILQTLQDWPGKLSDVKISPHE